MERVSICRVVRFLHCLLSHGGYLAEFWCAAIGKRIKKMSMDIATPQSLCMTHLEGQ